MRNLGWWMRYLFSLWIFLSACEGFASAYLSGYTWFHFANWKLTSEDYGRIPPQSFDPDLVKLGDTIFVPYDCIEIFARDYLPKIKTRIILITANYGHKADSPTPGPFAYLLKEERIAAWFVQNIDQPMSEKLIPIPIGLANSNWEHGNTDLFDRMIPIVSSKRSRSIFLYLNLTYRPERADCIHYFQSKGFGFSTWKSFAHYLEDLSESVFVASPRGNGLDTHRTWESLLMGCYPIVPNSTLNPLYENLPVVIIDSWEEVTPEFLAERFEELNSKQWSKEKLYPAYWFAKVCKIQNELRRISGVEISQ